MSSDCPCGRPRVGCEYHDPMRVATDAVREATERVIGAPPMWVDIEVRVSPVGEGTLDLGGAARAITPTEATEILAAIGLRGDAHSTGHAEWTRLFMVDPSGVTQGRMSFRNGLLQSRKWYVSGAWRLWVERHERLDVTRWNVAVQAAIRAAHAARDVKQARRDANPGPKRKPLQLNVRTHLGKILMGWP